jgi:hypothetical protein
MVEFEERTELRVSRRHVDVARRSGAAALSSS